MLDPDFELILDPRYASLYLDFEFYSPNLRFLSSPASTSPETKKCRLERKILRL